MITVVGLGFVGLTTALGLADKGVQVMGLDVDRKRVDQIKLGGVPFHEPGLSEALERTLGKTFRVTHDPEEAYAAAEIVFFCVGTPSSGEGSADLFALETAVGSALRRIPQDGLTVFVVKSTVPPGTTRDLLPRLIEKQGLKPGVDVGYASNPEFLREGMAWQDFAEPDRIVIGVDDEACGEILAKLYKPFKAPIHLVSTSSAEFIKYASNTLLATLISFSNELSMIADGVGDIDVKEAFGILHADRRWVGSPANMASYFYPGCGFGGYCLPKDTAALAARALEINVDPAILRAVLLVNARIKNVVVRKVVAAARKEDRIAVLGLAFKPDTDDVRETPAGDILQMLYYAGYHNIVAYDPMAMKNFAKEFKLDIEYASSVEEAARDAKVVVLLTAWKEFEEKRDLLGEFDVLDFRYIL